MSVRSIHGDERVGAQRGEVVVCITGDDREEQFVETLRSVVAHTAETVPILIYDTTGADRRLRDLPADTAKLVAQRVVYWQSSQDRGAAVAAAVAAAPADVVLLGSGCVVSDGWLPGLRDAAYVDAGVATASALTGWDSASLLAHDGRSFDDAAAAVRSSSLRSRPRVRRARGPCLFVRRSALELVGGLGLAESPAQVGVDFSRRCVEAGLLHVVADEVLVDDLRASPEPADRDADQTPPLARSLGAARRSLHGLSVVIDARILAGPMDGTRVHVVELVAAVARTGRARVTAILPDELDGDTRALLERMEGVALTTIGKGSDRSPAVRGDIVHRPFQISAPADLTALARLADRLVITHQDLISYHNSAYFPSAVAWEGYREMTRRALGAADRVLFFSAHVRDDALAEELVEPHRASVVQIGVDHALVASDARPKRPGGTQPLPDDAEMMLCLGTDFRHKNRIFALRILEELRRRHRWSGWLVMAGPRVAFGSSRADERMLLEHHPGLADAVLDLDALSEAEKGWLLDRASVVLYPTVHEGFGLIPFEAADHGVPCLWAAGTALGELLPDAAAGIVAWDPAASADRALALIRDEQIRAGNVEVVRTAAGTLRWDTTAQRLIELYHQVCDEPPAPASAFERKQGLMRGGLSEDAMRLVGPDGLLGRDLERPLLALASHPKLAAPVFGAIRAGYRASRRWRRSG